MSLAVVGCATARRNTEYGEGNMTNSNQLVQKLWNFCNVLRDDGVSTIEYVEQLTYLLFLKMAEERKQAGLGEVVPYGLDWPSLLDRDGDLRDLPLVLLYNKQDLPAEMILTPDALGEALNFRGAPSFACDALRGVGVLEALHSGVTRMMRRLAPAQGG